MNSAQISENHVAVKITIISRSILTPHSNFSWSISKLLLWAIKLVARETHLKEIQWVYRECEIIIEEIFLAVTWFFGNLLYFARNNRLFVRFCGKNQKKILNKYKHFGMERFGRATKENVFSIFYMLLILLQKITDTNKVLVLLLIAVQSVFLERKKIPKNAAKKSYKKGLWTNAVYHENDLLSCNDYFYNFKALYEQNWDPLTYNEAASALHWIYFFKLFNLRQNRIKVFWTFLT